MYTRMVTRDRDKTPGIYRNVKLTVVITTSREICRKLYHCLFSFMCLNTNKCHQ